MQCGNVTGNGDGAVPYLRATAAAADTARRIIVNRGVVMLFNNNSYFEATWCGEFAGWQGGGNEHPLPPPSPLSSARRGQFHPHAIPALCRMKHNSQLTQHARGLRHVLRVPPARCQPTPPSELLEQCWGRPPLQLPLHYQQQVPRRCTTQQLCVLRAMLSCQRPHTPDATSNFRSAPCSTMPLQRCA